MDGEVGFGNNHYSGDSLGGEFMEGVVNVGGAGSG